MGDMGNLSFVPFFHGFSKSLVRKAIGLLMKSELSIF